MTPPLTSSRRALTPLLAALAMFGPFSIDTIFPAFPAIAVELHADSFAMQQTISVYLLAYAAMALLHGPLSDALGRRRVILAGVAMFVVASIGCALSGSIGTLLAFRALQGFSAGAGLIVGRAIIRDCFHGIEAQKRLATVSVLFGIAPAIAPVIGGWVIAFAHWSMIFWLLAAFALMLWITCLAWLPETHPHEHRIALSPGVLAGAYRKVLADRTFFPLTLADALNFNAMWLYIASAPAVVLDLLKLDAQQFAWLFVPAISGMMLGAWTSGRMAGRWSVQTTTRAGYVVMLGASVLNLLVAFLLPGLRVPWAVLLIGVNAIGIGITAPTVILLLLDRFPYHRGAVSSVQTFVRLAINALTAGLVAPLLSGSMVTLAAGALASVILGAVAWGLYRRIERREQHGAVAVASTR